MGVTAIKTYAAFASRRKKKEKHIRKIWRFSLAFASWLLIAGGIVLSGSPAESEVSQPVKVVVDSGDTLWTLANIHAPCGMDVRDYLDEVLEKNELTGVLIYPGQEIVLP